MYLENLIDKVVKNYLDSKHDIKEQSTTRSEKKKRYFKLPYIGCFSNSTKKQLSTLVKKYCKSSKIKIVFTSFKIGSLFSTKDKIASILKSNVIYKFKCGNCNATYIGETTRHLKTRMDEHLKYKKESHIYQHIHNNISCLDKSNYDCFSILDSANTQWQLKLKEGLHISWENPDLNKQVKYVGKTLCL